MINKIMWIIAVLIVMFTAWYGLEMLGESRMDVRDIISHCKELGYDKTIDSGGFDFNCFKIEENGLRNVSGEFDTSFILKKAKEKTK